MNKLHSFLAVLIMALVLNQPTLASSQYNTEEMMDCVPVGDIAMKITTLQKMGYKREFIETSLEELVDEKMSLWITPISKLVFSTAEQSFEKIVKQAIGFCLNTMKMHKKGNISRHVKIQFSI